MGLYDTIAGAADHAAGSTDEAFARSFDDEEGGGLYDGAAGWLDHAAGSTDESIGRQFDDEPGGGPVDIGADIVTGDDPNDSVDLGQWFNKFMPGTPLAAAEEFGGPKEPETWEEGDGPFDVTQEESENTIEGWANNVTNDTIGLDVQKVLWLAIGLTGLYLLKPLLEIIASAAEAA